MEETYEQIKKMIADGFVEEAVAAARESMGGDNDSQLLYLMGNAYMKQGLRKEAMNAYRKAAEINPEGPAVEAGRMIDQIMAFYNKDLYNP